MDSLARATAATSAAASSRSPAPAARPPVPTKAVSDLILRNALRYTVSAREYALLHKYLAARSRLLRKRMPSVDTVQRLVDGPVRVRDRPSPLGQSSLHQGGREEGDGVKQEKERPKAAVGGASSAPKPSDKAARSRLTGASNGASVYGVGAEDYNARAIRHSLRVLVVTGVLMRVWASVSACLSRRGGRPSVAEESRKQPLHRSPALRLSLSLSTILLLHRLLFRFFSRLRLHLLDPSAAPFRQRNPATANTLTSPYAPPVGASLAGLALGIYPAQQLRVSITIYALFRALEFSWNRAEDSGAIWGWEAMAGGKDPGQRKARPRGRPWWWGSWMLQPLAFGQLLHAAVFDRDCFPTQVGDFLFKRSSAYLHPRPNGFPTDLGWPSPYEVMDNLARMARLNWPPFISPTLFPDKDDILPASLSAVAPLTSGAHPLITSLSCATLHPADPSCTRTFLTFWLHSFGPLARFFLVVYSAFLIPRLRSLYHFPVSTLHGLFTQALRTATFFTGSMSTAWASVCVFQSWFPRSFLPTQRFFLGGFLAGFWAWIERRQGRPVFLYTARMSVDSLWKVGLKRRWWRAMEGGDVWLFVLALMLTGVVYQHDARAVREPGWRKGISWVRGEGWRDWALDLDPDDDLGEEADRDAVDDDQEVPVA